MRPKGALMKKHEDVCVRLVALVDVAERLMKASKRRGHPELSAGEKKVLEYWLKEREDLEKRVLDNQHACPLCPGCPLCATGRHHSK